MLLKRYHQNDVDAVAVTSSNGLSGSSNNNNNGNNSNNSNMQGTLSSSSAGTEEEENDAQKIGFSVQVRVMAVLKAWIETHKYELKVCD